MADELEQHQTPSDNDVTDEDLEAQLAYENLKRRREAKRRKRTITIAVVVVIAIVAAIVFVASQAGSEDDSEADPLDSTIEVRREDFVSKVTANGATEPVTSTVVTPEVDGIIENLQAVEGTSVNAGDVLFTLKNDALDKAVREATDALAAAQRNADNANAGVDQAYANYQTAWRAANESDDWSSFDEGGLKGAITSAENSYSDSLAAVSTARANLAEAQANADKRIVRAPVSGTIVAVNAQNGAGVGGATGSQKSDSGSSGPLVQISDLSQMMVTVQINEIDIAGIAVGQSATATFSALPNVELAASVQRIASVSSGSGGDGGGGVVTYAVDLLIPAPDPNLKPGMTANVTIITQNVPDSLIVPIAVLNDIVEPQTEGQPATATLTVLTGETVEDTRDVTVEVVARSMSDAVVKGDVKEGDRVLLAGAGTDGGDVEDDLMSQA